MTAYKNFTVDLPQRLKQLDQQFFQIAKTRNLEVSYILMKLCAVFILPYERIEGTSGARTLDISDAQSVRKYLELDKKFYRSSYCKNTSAWARLDVDDFSRGPCSWIGKEKSLDVTAAEILNILRHSIAHSNLFFGGETVIEHIYFANKRERDRTSNKYTVIRCDVQNMINLIDAWIENLQTLRISPSLIWKELETAA